MEIFYDVKCSCGFKYRAVGNTNPQIIVNLSGGNEVLAEIVDGKLTTTQGPVRDIRVYSNCPECNNENINIIQEPLS